MYIDFQSLFLAKLTHLCTEFQKLDPPMYANFGFQNPPWLDHHGIQVFIEVSPGWRTLQRGRPKGEGGNFPKRVGIQLEIEMDSTPSPNPGW